MIYNNKLKKASQLIEKNRDEFGNELTALMFFLAKKHTRNAEAFVRGDFINSALTGFINVHCIRLGQDPKMALNFFINSKNARGPMNVINLSVIGMEGGDEHYFNKTISDLMDAEDKQSEIQRLSENLLISQAFPRDSVKFFKYLIEALQRDRSPKGKIKDCKADLFLFSNSLLISLFTKKKLKRNVPEWMLTPVKVIRKYDN